MIKRFIAYALIKLLGGEEMMAMFFAQRVILGITDFATIPSTLQPLVYDLLVESGVGFLAGDYTPPEND